MPDWPFFRTVLLDGHVGYLLRAGLGPFWLLTAGVMVLAGMHLLSNMCMERAYAVAN